MLFARKGVGNNCNKLVLLSGSFLGGLSSRLLLVTDTDTRSTTRSQEIARLSTVLLTNSVGVRILDSLACLFGVRNSRDHHDHGGDEYGDI